MQPLLLAGAPSPGSGVALLRNPYDQSPVGEVAQAGPTELEAAAAAAARAAPVAAALPAWRRQAILRDVVVRLRARAEALAAIIRDEGGKPIQYARLEVTRALHTLELCAEEATRIGGEVLPLDASAPGTGRTALLRRFPRGPVLAIAPFNFPLNLVVHKVGPAVAAGCPVVVKPAEQTPTAALWLGEALVEAGWPAEAISVLPCDRAVAAAMVGDPRLPVISFTGSDTVGWAIRAAAPRKHVVLELGGNAAVVLAPDADLDAALPRIAVNAYAHAGQVCISVQHVLVPAGRWAEVRDRFAALAAATPAGDPRLEATVCGPMIDGRARGRLLEWMGEAEALGGRRVVGGEVDGAVVRPAVYEAVPEGARLSREEAFGPVALLRPYATLEEAIAFVNGGRFGLQCGIYTRDVRTLWQAFEGLRCGGVIHDDVPSFRVDGMPYGGERDSGTGREGPRWAIEDFTELRTLVLRTA